MFHQLDSIEGKVDSIKDVVKWETQKAQYSADVHNINLAHSKMKELTDKLYNVICYNEKQCRRDKIKLIESYKKFFINAEKNVHKLIVGTIIKGSSVAAHMPSLLAKSSKCQVQKLKVPQPLTIPMLQMITLKQF